MSENFLKNHRVILFICAFFLMMSLQRFHATFIIIFSIPFAFWFLYSIFIICVKPEKRKNYLVKVIIFTVTTAIIVGINWYRSEAARHIADSVVVSLNEYKLKHSAYPASLEVIGLDTPRLGREMMLRYWLRDGQPTLVYASTLFPADKFFYNFEGRAWVLRED